MDDIVNVLLVHGNRPQVPDHNKFLWNAVAFLRTHPEACAGLQEAFLDPSANHTRRALILDLLVGAGHSNAQSVLRALLSSPVLDDDPRRLSLFQRVALLDRPDAETMQFASTRYASSLGSDRTAAAYTIGAVAARAGDPRALAKTRELLTHELDKARTSEDKKHGILALANTRAESNAEALREYLDEAPDIRATVANALADTPGSAARSMLLDLARDSDANVQSNAIRSLRQRGTSRELQQLRALAQGGSLADASLADYVRFANDIATEDSPTAVEALKAIADRGDNNTRLQVAGMLRALGATEEY